MRCIHILSMVDVVLGNERRCWTCNFMDFSHWPRLCSVVAKTSPCWTLHCPQLKQELNLKELLMPRSHKKVFMCLWLWPSEHLSCIWYDSNNIVKACTWYVHMQARIISHDFNYKIIKRLWNELQHVHCRCRCSAHISASWIRFHTNTWIQ